MVVFFSAAFAFRWRLGKNLLPYIAASRHYWFGAEALFSSPWQLLAPSIESKLMLQPPPLRHCFQAVVSNTKQILSGSELLASRRNCIFTLALGFLCRAKAKLMLKLIPLPVPRTSSSVVEPKKDWRSLTEKDWINLFCKFLWNGKYPAFSFLFFLFPCCCIMGKSFLKQEECLLLPSTNAVSLFWREISYLCAFVQDCHIASN